MEQNINNLNKIKLLSGLNNICIEELKKYLEFKNYPSNFLIVEEGNNDSLMYFILDGCLSIYRNGINLGNLKSGNHFGEIALITGKPRSATIKTETDVILAELTKENYEKLILDNPSLAIKFIQSVVSSLSKQLVEMTDNYSLYLKQRSNPRKNQVSVEINNEIKEVQTGTFIDELLITKNDNSQIVSALLNNKIVPLHTQIFSDSVLSPLNVSNWEGERIYRRSTTFLLFATAKELYPDLKFSLGASIGQSQWIYINSNKISLEEVSQNLLKGMKKSIKNKISFNEELWTLEEAISFFTEQNELDIVDIIKTWHEPNINIINCGKLYSVKFEPLVSNASLIKDFYLQTFDSGIILIAGKQTEADNSASSPYINLMKKNDIWLNSLGVGTVGKFNQECIKGNVSKTIQVAEGYHEKNISKIADLILEDKRNPKIICISGPSSSGKTTFIKRLNIQLLVNGLKPLNISLDDYYVDREKNIKDENGEYDFEALEALDLKNFRNHMKEILKGKKVNTAFFDFKEGKSYPNGGKKVELRDDSLLLLEGIHGLNPKLFGNHIPQNKIFKIFIQPMASLSFDSVSRINPSDVRLLRRIIRDRRLRGLSPQDNIMRWSSVRKGEIKNIFPFVGLADIVFDTSLIYELAVLKVYAERYLLEVHPEHPAYTTAFRLRKLIQLFVSIYPDHVPSLSLLREFIGGSGFEY